MTKNEKIINRNPKIVDGPKKSKKLSCVQNIDNNEILKVTKFQTCGTIGLFARLDISRDGPHRPPLGVNRVKLIKQAI